MARKKEISPAAQAAIADRVRLSRPDVVADIRTVLSSRGGRATLDQLDTLARLIAADVPADMLQGVVVGLLAECRVKPDIAAPWWDTGWPVLIAAVQAAERGAGDPPPAPTIDQCREAYHITDEEAVELALRTLKSDTRRMRQTRADTALAPPRGPGRPKKHDIPPDVPPATFYRRLARQTAEKERAIAAEVRAVAAGERKSVPIGNYGNPPEADRPESSLYDSMCIGTSFLSLPPPGREWAAPVAGETPRQVENRLACIGTWPTVEALRLVALAARYGLWWAAEPDYIEAWRSETWFAPPPDSVTLTTEQEVALVVAHKAADGGEKRDRGHARAERLFHARGREESARWNKRPLAQRIAIQRKQDAAQRAETPPDGRPLSVSQAVWDAVPPDWREEVTRLAGLFFVNYDDAPDVAVLRAVWTYRRDLDRLEADNDGDDDPEAAVEPAPVAFADHPRYKKFVRCVRLESGIGRAHDDRALREVVVAEALRLAEAIPGLLDRWDGQALSEPSQFASRAYFGMDSRPAPQGAEATTPRRKSSTDDSEPRPAKIIRDADFDQALDDLNMYIDANGYIHRRR